MPLSAPAQLTLAFAQNGVKNTIPNPSQIAVTPGLASYNDGFPPLTRTAVAAGGVPPFGEDMNGVLYALSLALQWEQAGGAYVFSSAFATAVGGYPLAATVYSSDGAGNWLNTTANNTNDPEAVAAPNGWQPVLQRGITGVALTNANVTLTNLQSAKENIVFTGALTGNVVVTVAAFIKDFKFINGTTGAFTLQVKTPTGGAITLGAGATTLRGDGTTLNGPDALNVGAATLPNQALQAGQATRRWLGRQLVSVTGTYTPGTYTINGVTYTATVARFWGQASGGAGGGAVTTGAGQASAGAGGNAGNPFDFWVTSGLAAMSITVGAPGTGVVAAAGNSGGDLIIGAIATIKGGKGGSVGGLVGTFPSFNALLGTANAASTIASSGGMTVTGVVNAYGQQGYVATLLQASAVQAGQGGTGAWGTVPYGAASGSLGFGVGGNGALNGPSVSQSAGQSGMPVLLAIDEYA